MLHVRIFSPQGVSARTTSPQPGHYRPKPPGSAMAGHRGRPVSARTPPSPRPSSAGQGQGQQQGSRPQSAKVPRAQQDVNLVPQDTFAEESSPAPDNGEPVSEQVIQLDMPSTETAAN